MCVGAKRMQGKIYKMLQYSTDGPGIDGGYVQSGSYESI